MTQHLSQPIGHALPDWQPCATPVAKTLSGRTCRLEPLTPTTHASALTQVFLHANAADVWTYLPFGPFADATDFHQHLTLLSQSHDVLHFAVIDTLSQQPIGTIALMRIDAANGVAEIGYVTFSPTLQRTTMATEAIFLLLEYLFSALNYRRCEWKCDHLNALPAAPQQGLVFSLKAYFAKPRYINNAIAIRHGMPSSINTGQAFVPPSPAGYLRITSPTMACKNRL